MTTSLRSRDTDECPSSQSVGQVALSKSPLTTTSRAPGPPSGNATSLYIADQRDAELVDLPW
jgi:hypothetical protein